jgi:hypothetical protein
MSGVSSAARRLRGAATPRRAVEKRRDTLGFAILPDTLVKAKARATCANASTERPSSTSLRSSTALCARYTLGIVRSVTDRHGHVTGVHWNFERSGRDLGGDDGSTGESGWRARPFVAPGFARRWCPAHERVRLWAGKNPAVAGLLARTRRLTCQ